MELALFAIIQIGRCIDQVFIYFICRFYYCCVTTVITYSFKGAGKYTVDNIDPSLCTHFVYAFAILDPNSFKLKIYDTWGDIDLGGYSKFIGLKAQNPSLKMMISLGGWTDSTDGSRKYSKLVASSANIASFVNSVMSFLPKYGFDGLDIDWEYPSTPSDKIGLIQLLRALRTAFNPSGYLLSVAVPANPITATKGDIYHALYFKYLPEFLYYLKKIKATIWLPSSRPLTLLI